MFQIEKNNINNYFFNNYKYNIDYIFLILLKIII